MNKFKKRHTLFSGMLMLSLFFVSIAVPATAHAFRSVTQESFTDPDYISFQPKAIAIQVNAKNIDARKAAEKYLVADLEKRGINVYLERELFSPTRKYDEAQRAEVYTKNSIDAGLIITAGESSEQAVHMWQQTSFNANTTFSGNSARTTGYSTTSRPGAKSQAAYSAVLVSLIDNRVAWTTDIYIKAGGLLFVGGKRDAKAASKTIIKGLIEKNHVPG